MDFKNGYLSFLILKLTIRLSFQETQLEPRCIVAIGCIIAIALITIVDTKS